MVNDTTHKKTNQWALVRAHSDRESLVRGWEVRRAIISGGKETGTKRSPSSSQCPVPQGGGHRAGPRNVRGKQSHLLSPRESPCSGWRGYKESATCRIDECMDRRWTMQAGSFSRPMDQTWKGTGASLENAESDMGTKPTTVCWCEALS